MGKGRKQRKGGGGEEWDSSDADTMSTTSTAPSEFMVAQSTEHVNSQEFVLDKYIDALYEKRGTTREAALSALVDAFESFVLLDFVETKYATLSSQFLNSVKKGSTKEACLACRATGLLAITLGAGTAAHDIMEELVPQLNKILQAGGDATKMISVLECLATVTFVGANDLAETELTLRTMWDVIRPKSGANVAPTKKPKPPVLAAAVSSWGFLLTTTASWRKNPETWKESIAFFPTLLEVEDRAVRIAAGEAIALCFELKLLDVSTSEQDDNAVGGGSRNQLFLYMQAMKAKIAAQVSNLAMEAGGKGADKKNLNDQRDLFQSISDFIQSGEKPEESLKVSGRHGILRVSSWAELIQLNFLKRYLGRGFLKHAQDNGLLHEVFNFSVDRTESLSATAKKFHRSEEEKGRAQKLNKERRLAQERKQSILNEQEG